MDRKGRKALHPCVRQMLWYTFSFYSPKRRAQIAEKICGAKPACLPGDMLTAIRKREGFKALLLSEWILFGGCVIVCLLLDLLFVHRNVLWKIFGLLACMIPFFFCEESKARMQLKAIYLLFSFFFGDYWALTALFLIIFEHLAVSDDSENKGVDA